jgi:N-carbamoylputrescine amidase
MQVALIQHAVAQDKAQTQRKTLSLIQEAASYGAELIVLQELHQGEYFCITENPSYFDLAENFEEDVAFWASVAKEYGVVLVTSLFEKRAPGLYHNTAVVFEKDGSIAGKYRKMHIPDDPGFYEKFYFTPGDLGYHPIQTSVGKLGVLVCWDQWYPEAARLMALRGADILIYPTAIGWFESDPDDEKARQQAAWVGIQRGHAIANGLPVVAVNRIGKELDPTGALDGILFWGHSFVAGPQGELLHVSSDDKEEVALVDIDLKRCEEVRRMWPFLRDRRIETYEELTKRYID